jgi:hypothetical protein
MSSRASEVLSRYKIDPNNMKSSESYLDEAKAIESQTASLMQQLEENTNEYNDAKAFVDSYKPITGADGKPIYSDKYNEMKKLVDKFDSEGTLAGLQNAIKNNNTIINEKQAIAEAVNNFRSSMDAQQAARKAIADINKEITTLSDEKKQRQTFWQVDTSPKKSVKEALANNQPPVTNGIDYSPKDDDNSV